MVNDIWAAATVHVEPRPLTQNRDSALTFLQHDRIIKEQLAGTPRGSFVGGIKKDVVVSNKLAEKPNRVAIYGWHYMNGEPIQPVYAGHVDWYLDYSHGIRPVRRTMRVDGVRMSFEAIMADSTRRYLLSDEGAITALRRLAGRRENPYSRAAPSPRGLRWKSLQNGSGPWPSLRCSGTCSAAPRISPT